MLENHACDCCSRAAPRNIRGYQRVEIGKSSSISMITRARARNDIMRYFRRGLTELSKLGDYDNRLSRV